MKDGKRFRLQGTVTWNGDPEVRVPGSTGKVREITRTRVYVSWGYRMDVVRDQQPDAEGWESRRDLLPGFVDEDALPPREESEHEGDEVGTGDACVEGAQADEER